MLDLDFFLFFCWPSRDCFCLSSFIFFCAVHSVTYKNGHFLRLCANVFIFISTSFFVFFFFVSCRFFLINVKCYCLLLVNGETVTLLYVDTEKSITYVKRLFMASHFFSSNWLIFHIFKRFRSESFNIALSYQYYRTLILFSMRFFVILFFFLSLSLFLRFILCAAVENPYQMFRLTPWGYEHVLWRRIQ